jgi:Sec-independent protein translocase protein TatA
MGKLLASIGAIAAVLFFASFLGNASRSSAETVTKTQAVSELSTAQKKQVQDSNAQVERAREMARQKEINAEVSISELSTAQKLAYSDGLNPNNKTTADVFAKLDRMCVEDDERLGNVVAASVLHIRKKGGKTSLLGFMKGLLTAFSDHPDAIESCAEGSAMLITMMLSEK